MPLKPEQSAVFAESLIENYKRSWTETSTPTDRSRVLALGVRILERITPALVLHQDTTALVNRKHNMPPPRSPS